MSLYIEHLSILQNVSVSTASCFAQARASECIVCMTI